MSKLDEIFAHKRAEVISEKARTPLVTLQAVAAAASPPRAFSAALRRARARPALIAEIKHRSPSRGLLVANSDPLKLAAIYAENGAAAISVLTDERFFGGSLDHLRAVAAQIQDGRAQGLPLLRKDFICDPYQVYQARAAGADAILLIVAALPSTLLAELLALAHDLGMAALVETHDAAELETALVSRARLIGINNRNLHDFTVSLETTLRLGRRVPADVCLVAESGIHTPEHVALLRQVPRPGATGVDAILVGEALVTAPDVGAKVRELAGSPQSHQDTTVHEDES